MIKQIVAAMVLASATAIEISTELEVPNDQFYTPCDTNEDCESEEVCVEFWDGDFCVDCYDVWMC